MELFDFLLEGTDGIKGLCDVSSTNMIPILSVALLQYYCSLFVVCFIVLLPVFAAVLFILVSRGGGWWC